MIPVIFIKILRRFNSHKKSLYQYFIPWPVLTDICNIVTQLEINFLQAIHVSFWSWTPLYFFITTLSHIGYPSNLPNSQGVVEGQHFYQAIQNGTWTAIVFACQSKTHILKNSGFWFYNIITHWRQPGKGMQKSKQNPNEEAKNRESYWTVIIAIKWEFDWSLHHYSTLLLIIYRVVKL